MHGLLRLYDLELTEASAADGLAQCALNRTQRGESDTGVQTTLILNHGRPVRCHWASVEVRKICVYESLGKFDLTLASDIVEHNVIAVPDSADRASRRIHTHERLHRFIIFTGAVSRAHSRAEGCD